MDGSLDRSRGGNIDGSFSSRYLKQTTIDCAKERVSSVLGSATLSTPSANEEPMDLVVYPFVSNPSQEEIERILIGT